MSKYIDAEKLKATLETRIAAGMDGYGGNLKWLLENIDSLQQEQPSLPDNLDEAAEKQARSFGYMKEDYEYKELIETFKAGAEWMAEQGVIDSIEGTVCGRVYDHINIRYTDDVGKTLEPRNISHIPVDVNKYKIGDKVIVQIRKKDE